MSKVFKIIADVILCMIIVILLVCSYLRYTNQVMIFKVATGSMEHGIHVGDYIVVKHSNSYKVGDVVTYQKGNINITHRIIKISGDRIVTKGDSNNTEDEEITSDSILGKFIYRGWILNFFMNYRYFIIAFFIILFLVSDILARMSLKKGEFSSDKEEDLETIKVNNDKEEDLENLQVVDEEKGNLNLFEETNKDYEIEELNFLEKTDDNNIEEDLEVFENINDTLIEKETEDKVEEKTSKKSKRKNYKRKNKREQERKKRD